MPFSLMYAMDGETIAQHLCQVVLGDDESYASLMDIMAQHYSHPHGLLLDD